MIYRVLISPQEQKIFFKKAKKASNLNWKDLSKICGVSDRTLRDWARVKFTPSYKVLNFLVRRYKLDLPKGFKLLEQYWYIKKSARLGGLAYYKMYGPPGSLESRKEGYLKAVSGGEFTTRKTIKPLKLSVSLAELAGILLGDGGITRNQVRVTLNSKTDANYSDFVARLIKKIFRESPYIHKRKSSNALDLILSGMCYVEELQKIGLKKGNKIVNQVAIPDWILKNKEYARACLRGLVDTDGGVYFHNHIVRGKRYLNFGLTFTNASRPLILGAKNILERNELKVFMPRVRHLYVYDFDQIKQYFKIIGSSNSKHLERFKFYVEYYNKHKK